MMMAIAVCCAFDYGVIGNFELVVGFVDEWHVAFERDVAAEFDVAFDQKACAVEQGGYALWKTGFHFVNQLVMRHV